jgi:hypothetical protein
LTLLFTLSIKKHGNLPYVVIIVNFKVVINMNKTKILFLSLMVCVVGDLPAAFGTRTNVYTHFREKDGSPVIIYRDLEGVTEPAFTLYGPLEKTKGNVNVVFERKETIKSGYGEETIEGRSAILLDENDIPQSEYGLLYARTIEFSGDTIDGATCQSVDADLLKGLENELQNCGYNLIKVGGTYRLQSLKKETDV